MLNLNKTYMIRLTECVVLIGLCVYYNMLYDLGIIFLLLISSILVGKKVRKNLQDSNNTIVNCVMGAGIIGVAVYFIILFGLGNRAVYMIILLTPIVFSLNELKEIYRKGKIQFTEHRVTFFEVIFIITVIIYFVYASAPISYMEGDALSKHLPITLKAAESGRWYTNVVEDIVYGESMLMQYTFSAIFASFSAFKALTLFNTIANIITFFAVKEICSKIYVKTNIWIFACIYFTTPLLFDLSTIFYLDILPSTFLFSAMILICEIDKEKIWSNLPCIGFLFGCALFSKLTIVYSVLTVGGIAILGISFYLKQLKDIKQLIVKLFLSGLAFVSPFITSILIIYYKIGNPFLPTYNSIFKSPYFTDTNFVDIYNENPLGLSLQSLLNIVFHTNLNRVDGPDGALGLYLLLIFLTPIAVYVCKSKKITIWIIIPFITYSIACFFTYNVRYFASVFILFMIAICVTISILLDKIPQSISKILVVFLTAFILIPNIYVIGNYYDYFLKQSLVPNNDISLSVNTGKILKEIPQNKRVLSANMLEQAKGEYKGFYVTTSWRNTYLLNKLGNDNKKWMDFIYGFDYIINRKDLQIEQKFLEELIESASHKNSILSLFSTKDNMEVYKINKEKIKPHLLFEKKYESPITVSEPSPIVKAIDNLSDYYIITEDIKNITNKTIMMRFQINWLDKDDQFIDTNIITFEAEPGRKTYTSDKIIPPRNAKKGLVIVGTHSAETIELYGFSVSTQNSMIDDEIEKFNHRELLK